MYCRYIHISQAQAGNVKLSQMFMDKGLEAHLDETFFFVFGSSEFKDTISKQLEDNPLYFGDFPVKRKDSEKWCQSKLCSNNN